MRKSKLNKKSKLKVSKLKNKLDIAFSFFIRKRDKKCFFCSNPATQNSHYWGRANMCTRYDEENCDGICGGCHMKHESNKQGLYREKKIAQLKIEKYNALQKRAESICRLTIPDYLKLLDKYTLP